MKKEIDEIEIWLSLSMPGHGRCPFEVTGCVRCAVQYHNKILVSLTKVILIEFIYVDRVQGKFWHNFGKNPDPLLSPVFILKSETLNLSDCAQNK